MEYMVFFVFLLLICAGVFISAMLTDILVAD